MMIEMNTYEYVRSHGHFPRGRGSWIFEARIGGGKDYVTKADGSMYFNGTFSEARRAAIARLKELVAEDVDFVELIVCS